MSLCSRRRPSDMIYEPVYIGVKFGSIEVKLSEASACTES